MTNPHRTFTFSITAAGLLAVLTCDAPTFAQDPVPPAIAPGGPASPSLRYNVSNEWEMHRRSASPDYRPRYRSLFVDPGYSGYCPIQPYWNGVFSAGGSPRAGACCPLFSK